jgi:hypothetical protein
VPSAEARTIEPSQTQGWPPRIWRSASLVTWTAIRSEDGAGNSASKFTMRHELYCGRVSHVCGMHQGVGEQRGIESLHD